MSTCTKQHNHTNNFLLLAKQPFSSQAAMSSYSRTAQWTGPGGLPDDPTFTDSNGTKTRWCYQCNYWRIFSHEQPGITLTCRWRCQACADINKARQQYRGKHRQERWTAKPSPDGPALSAAAHTAASSSTSLFLQPETGLCAAGNTAAELSTTRMSFLGPELGVLAAAQSAASSSSTPVRPVQPDSSPPLPKFKGLNIQPTSKKGNKITFQ